MILNDDYRDMLRDLSGEKVKFLLVGAYAMGGPGKADTTEKPNRALKGAPTEER